MEPEMRREIARHRQAELARLAKRELLLSGSARGARRRWMDVLVGHGLAGANKAELPVASPGINGSP